VEPAYQNKNVDNILFSKPHSNMGVSDVVSYDIGIVREPHSHNRERPISPINQVRSSRQPEQRSLTPDPHHSRISKVKKNHLTQSIDLAAQPSFKHNLSKNSFNGIANGVVKTNGRKTYDGDNRERHLINSPEPLKRNTMTGGEQLNGGKIVTLAHGGGSKMHGGDKVLDSRRG